jgi:hypothetical protein
MSNAKYKRQNEGWSDAVAKTQQGLACETPDADQGHAEAADRLAFATSEALRLPADPVQAPGDDESQRSVLGKKEKCKI